MYTKEKIILTLAKKYIEYGRELNGKEINRIKYIPSVLTIKNILNVDTSREIWNMVRQKINDLKAEGGEKGLEIELNKNEYTKPVCGCESLLECFKFIRYKAICPIQHNGEIDIENLNSREILKKDYILKCNNCNNSYKVKFDRQGRVHKGDLIK